MAGIRGSLTEKMIERLALNGDELVLDVATGTGRVARPLSKHIKSGRIVGVDQAFAMLDVGHQHKDPIPHYEQSAGETQALFQSANERFAESVQGMKQMAAEMQRELESTRNELRRGVFELPQETAESAAQMRRVIVDQIEALAELNRIVARHGRNLDAVEPVLHRTREEPTLAVVGGRSEPPRAPADIPRSEMPPPQPPRPPQRSESSGFAPPARRAPAEPAVVPAR